MIQPADDPLWYQDAVIYEVHVRAFGDASGDGVGDFRGLTARLDYLQDLGVTAIWLLPFYPSPLRDDGYDIADYTSVHPAYGTIGDFRAFLAEAHRRGLRVITELVINHTSDQHPWFQRARRAEPGSTERDFYVWSDTPDRYQKARVIFQDTETSNWAWDPVAKGYYWHRFFSHQPDLNYDNPAVREAVHGVLDFWLDLGVDGLRLDAIPYLFEREGTMCENLPETHAELKVLRRRVDEKYRNRMLLAEANQWPEDAVAYFGDGDECHMSFHFPLMPRLFMSIEMENRFPIVDILDQTPPIPAGCQWAIFLRNHDELTLEMVTEEERDYMYRTYAQDRRARLNLGIRRRLAPLLGNDRRKIELMNGLLMSMPGTPVLYYGDELGMGDNIYLGDRNGVRTPMQWSNDRNAGFSSANPQSLYLPLIVDPEYHYETVNVEAQLGNPNSLLWWTKRLIALRRRQPVFGRGAIEFLHPDNPRVLAFLRRLGDTTVLCVANLSRRSQFVELELTEFIGFTPVEMFGRTEFPLVRDQPYLLTLGPHAFYWFQMEPAREPAAVSAPAAEPLHTGGELIDLFDGRLSGVVAEHLVGRIWYHGHGRRPVHAGFTDVIPLRPPEGPDLFVTVIDVEFSAGPPQRYLMPLAVAFDEQAAVALDRPPETIVTRIVHDGRPGVVYDATREPAWQGEIGRLITDGGEVVGRRGTLVSAAAAPDQAVIPDGATAVTDSPEGHTQIVLGGAAVLKVFRLVEDGVNPDLELRRFLTERTAFAALPEVTGSLDYRPSGGEPATLAILQEYVPHEADAWTLVADSLRRHYEEAAALPEVERAAIRPPAPTFLELVDDPVPPDVAEDIDSDLQLAEQLGSLTASLHRALASAPDHPEFRVERFSPLYQRGLYQSFRSSARQALAQARRRAGDFPQPLATRIREVGDREDEVLETIGRLLETTIEAARIRCHGDYRLDEVLSTGREFIAFDFAGDTTRPLSQRRLKESPLRDVADMLRSLHYASLASLLGQVEAGVIGAEAVDQFIPYAARWYRWVGAAFLRRYLADLGEADLLPEDRASLAALLRAYMIDRAMRELIWELEHRPDWIVIPLAGIREELGDTPGL